jgi:hypothetical protein
VAWNDQEDIIIALSSVEKQRRFLLDMQFGAVL